jgi:hypothetical protein
VVEDESIHSPPVCALHSPPVCALQTREVSMHCVYIVLVAVVAVAVKLDAAGVEQPKSIATGAMCAKPTATHAGASVHAFRTR